MKKLLLFVLFIFAISSVHVLGSGNVAISQLDKILKNLDEDELVEIVWLLALERQEQDYYFHGWSEEDKKVFAIVMPVAISLICCCTCFCGAFAVASKVRECIEKWRSRSLLASP